MALRVSKNTEGCNKQMITKNLISSIEAALCEEFLAV
jgi:hypothetical protein